MKCFEEVQVPSFKQRSRPEATDVTDDMILNGAKSIAKALAVPGGQASLDFVVARHLPWFNAAQARGMSWKHITDVLFTAGAKRLTGKRFSTGHLSAVVWRQREQTEANEMTRGMRIEAQRDFSPIPPPIAATLNPASKPRANKRSLRSTKKAEGDRTIEVSHAGDRPAGSDAALIRASMNRRTPRSTSDARREPAATTPP